MIKNKIGGLLENAFIRVCFLVLTFHNLFGCAATSGPAMDGADLKDRNAKQSIVFKNLMWSGELRINLESNNVLNWSEGIDGRGSGSICDDSFHMECVLLDGLWSFAIPKAVVALPRLGQAWQYNDVNFRVVELMHWQNNNNDGAVLVVSAMTLQNDVIFHYRRGAGIQFVSYMRSDDSATNEQDGSKLMASVWIRDFLLD